MANKTTTLGVIGGTGLYELEGLTNVEVLQIETPFGSPSSPVTKGRLGQTELLFIARHGIGHTISPSEINFRANIFALKTLGAEWCLSVSAVGSLKEECMPGHAVIPNQFIDRTKNRESSFFSNGIVAHVSFADPFCPTLRRVLLKAATLANDSAERVIHDSGTYVVMEGPAFSTRAESQMYRSLGGTLIGMTNLPEAKLAREAEIAYATLALVTDYDCWRSEAADVDISQILDTLKKNSSFGKEVVRELAKILPSETPSELARNALRSAILTAKEHIPEVLKKQLAPILSRYL